MIINQYAVTKERYMYWFRLNQKTGVQLRITIMWSCIFVLLVAAGFAVVLHPDMTDPLPWLGIELLFILYAGYHLFFRRAMIAGRTYDKMAASFGKDWTRTIDFRKDMIVISEGNYEVKYPYSEISYVKNIGDLIMLETDKTLVIHAYKNDFAEGDYPKFRRFIESRVVNRCRLS